MLVLWWVLVGIGVWLGLSASKLDDFAASTIDQKLVRFGATVFLWPGALWHQAGLDYVKVRNFLSDIFDGDR